MFKPLLVSAFLLCNFNLIKAQTAQDSVKDVINKMFAAMKNANSSELVTCFADGAILQTVVESNGKTSIKSEKVKDFSAMLKTLKPGEADERITFDIVQTDGALATAWTPYNFYYKGEFSHCGIDSYQLVRINGLWKIQYLIDTRRKQGCKF